jgi:hypothetical protein
MQNSRVCISYLGFAIVADDGIRLSRILDQRQSIFRVIDLLHSAALRERVGVDGFQSALAHQAFQIHLILLIPLPWQLQLVHRPLPSDVNLHQNPILSPLRHRHTITRSPLSPRPWNSLPHLKSTLTSPQIHNHQYSETHEKPILNWRQTTLSPEKEASSTQNGHPPPGED